MNFYSHQGILLKYHLKEVGEKSKSIIKSKLISDFDAKILAEISYVIGVCHDFGKYTTFFQQKLKGLQDDNLTRHGLISALFAFVVVNKYLFKNKLINEKPYSFLPLLAYFVVKHHHGNLNDIFDDTNESVLFNSGFRNISEQVKDILQNQEEIKKEYNILLGGYGLSTDDIFQEFNIFDKRVENEGEIRGLLKNNIGKQTYFFKKEKNIAYYLITQLLYSALIDSDKKHAGNVQNIPRNSIPSNLVEFFLNSDKFKSNNQSKINKIRYNIRKSVLRNINTTNKIFTLTAPTGTGKTLTSFSAALKLRTLLKKELRLEYEPRIIYSLPFTSIIDQTFEIFDEILNQIPEYKNAKSEFLIKHHYLSEIFYKAKSKEESLSVDESLALIESWDSEIIVTTFIQLFHTLIGYKNRSLKKFHNIVNSIIILDEVQNIPIEYWNLVREVLLAITKYFNCRIILMTATKPLIFNTGEYIELVDDYEKYFKTEELNRVTLKFDSSETIQDFFANVSNNINQNSYLFVFNTINSSLEFYEKIKNIDNYTVFYLSTNIIPKERRKRIDEIKSLIKKNKTQNKKKKFIVVTTQLIEAGVDIDCEVGYRDLSTLDSIIQVAGRCNRNRNLENSDVYILNLKNENHNNKEYSSYIYSPKLLDITNNIIKNSKNVPEKEFLEIINQYFIKVKNSTSINTDLIESIRKLFFDNKKNNKCKKINPISCFKLINENYTKYDVFVEIDKEAKKIWKKYKKISLIKNTIKRKNEFLKIKKDFYSYVISLPEKYFQEPPEEIVYYLDNNKIKELSIYYSITGFNRNGILPIEHLYEFI